MIVYKYDGYTKEYIGNTVTKSLFPGTYRMKRKRSEQDESGYLVRPHARSDAGISGRRCAERHQ